MAAFAAACTPPTNPPIDSGTIASQVPLSGTPTFGPTVTTGNGPSVNAIAQAGNFMVAGGSFSTVNGDPHPFLAAWTAPAGALVALPANTVDGEVDAIEPSAGGAGFYAAGHITHANGTVSTNVIAYNLVKNQLSPTFRVTVNGTVNTLQLVGSRLFIGGFFSLVDGQLRFGLASVNATTGAVDNYLAVRLSGHHNFNNVNHGTVSGVTGAKSMAVSPDGSRLVVIGNFTAAYNDEFAKTTAYARDQIVNIRLSTPTPTVDPNWATLAFHPKCNGNAFDSYVSQVAWAPNGSFFVVVDAGGYTAGSLQRCDSASRFNASATGLNVGVAWSQYTGTDSLYSVAVTSAAVYIGGHERWLNNPLGQDNAQSGAVPRPGIAALDPASGEPLAWNPGRNPRGHGTAAIYATKAGVWFGSDTNCIGPGAGNSCVGPNTYERDELAYFPYAGGTLPAANGVGAGTRVIKAGSFTSTSDTLSESAFNPANGAGAPVTPPSNGGISWHDVRGSFTLNGRIYYGKSNGNFYYRTYRGGVFGPETLIDPYDDPTWDSVLTGSPTGSMNNYTGKRTGVGSFAADIPNITAMFYANRSIYYTLANDTHLYQRAFSPGTQASSVSGQDTGGVVGPIRTAVNVGGLVNFSNVGGMFVAGGKLWLGARTTGALYGANWNGTTVTSHDVKDNAATGTWTGRAVFVAQ